MCLAGRAQDATLVAAIEAEGKRLYRSEMASWHGSDILVERFPDVRSRMGGYFSYANQAGASCVFFSSEASPRILLTVDFDSTYDVARAHVDNRPRNFTSTENELYLLRKQAAQLIETDTLFETYQNTNLNIIPLLGPQENKVYVLTGPQQSGHVIFGNDYLLLFDKRQNLLSKRKLHKGIIPIKTEVENESVVASMHSHLPETGEYMTATDVCTLMLYGRFTKWQQHLVVSENYVSVWDCGKNTLLTLTKKAWLRISKDQKKRK